MSFAFDLLEDCLKKTRPSRNLGLISAACGGAALLGACGNSAIGPRSRFSTSSSALMADLSNEREEVVSAVECKVRDPGDLTGYLGIAKESKLRIESLSTGSSTVLVEAEAYFTGFPALLSFHNRKFSFEGTEVSQAQTSVSIDIQGNFGSRSQGEFLFYFKDPEQEALGSAALSDCTRVK